MEAETISYSLRSSLITQKHHSTNEIIRLVQQGDGDETVESICREYDISTATFRGWRRKYGDIDLADAKRLKEFCDDRPNLLHGGRDYFLIAKE